MITVCGLFQKHSSQQRKMLNIKDEVIRKLKYKEIIEMLIPGALIISISSATILCRFINIVHGTKGIQVFRGW